MLVEDAISVRQTQLEEKAQQIEAKVAKDPQRSRLVWELASVKLEAYFDRNLAQFGSIFGIAVFAMLVGFGFVLYGIVLIYHHPDQFRASLISAVAGVITEFVGATFVLIYRSTISQANSFVSVLERMNTVGMAVQILDSIPDEHESKDKTRAEIAKLLLTNNQH